MSHRRRSLAASVALLAGALTWLVLPVAAGSAAASGSRVDGGQLGNSTLAGGSIELLSPDTLGSQGSPRAGQKAPDPTAVEYG